MDLVVEVSRRHRNLLLVDPRPADVSGASRETHEVSRGRTTCQSPIDRSQGLDLAAARSTGGIDGRGFQDPGAANLTSLDAPTEQSPQIDLYRSFDRIAPCNTMWQAIVVIPTLGGGTSTDLGSRRSRLPAQGRTSDARCGSTFSRRRPLRQRPPRYYSGDGPERSTASELTSATSRRPHPTDRLHL